MSVNELRDFIFENHYKRIGIFKGKKNYSMKRLKKKKKRSGVACNQTNKKIPDPSNAKEQCQSLIRNKITKSEIITYQLKISENLNIVDIKSVITEHPKASDKLSKIEKLGSNSSLYSDNFI